MIGCDNTGLFHLSYRTQNNRCINKNEFARLRPYCKFIL